LPPNNPKPFKLNHGTITFDVKFSNTAAANRFSLNLNFAAASIKLVYVKGVGRLQAAAAA
jgi:hypothetical protein